MLALALAGWNHPLGIALPLMLLGIGHGLLMPAALGGTVGLVPALAGAAAGVAGVTQQLLGALAGWTVGLGAAHRCPRPRAAHAAADLGERGRVRRVVEARVAADALFAARLFARGVAHESASTDRHRGRSATAALFRGFGADRQSPARSECLEGEGP